MNKRIEDLARLLEKEQLEQLIINKVDCEGNRHNHKVSIKEGNKYIKVDVGTSGKYMIDKEGNIWGIKAYGQIHKGHYYGTLDTINNYYWGNYTAVRKI
jgi:hypothetical protein